MKAESTDLMLGLRGELEFWWNVESQNLMIKNEDNGYNITLSPADLDLLQYLVGQIKKDK